MAAPAPREGFVPGEVRLRYVEWGEPTAPCLVLLHGLRAYANWFEEFAEAAAGDFRVIALDQRGRGGSDWSPDGAYGTADYVADAARLADTLALSRFSLIGHSMGGTNALRFAERYPERMESLVIVDSAPDIAPAGLARMRAEMAATPPRFATWVEAETFLHRLHHRATARSLRTRLHWMLREAADGGVEWRIDPRIFETRVAADPPERNWTAFAAITCPALIVHGALSDAVTGDMAESVRAAMRNAARTCVADAGHMIVEENPEGFTIAVLPFLKDQLLS